MERFIPTEIITANVGGMVFTVALRDVKPEPAPVRPGEAVEVPRLEEPKGDEEAETETNEN